jgi:hypothetical protein
MKLLLLAILVAVAVVPQPAAATAAPADGFDKSRCPAWLGQYESWHVANRGAAGARYLIADAVGILGVGDNLRGMMYALRVAAATNRVLLLRWEHPGNLTDFLVPGSSVDWATWEGTPAVDLLAADRRLKLSTAETDVFKTIGVRAAFPNLTHFSHGLTNKTFLVLKTNFPAESACLMCPPVAGTTKNQSYDFVCMFR